MSNKYVFEENRPPFTTEELEKAAEVLGILFHPNKEMIAELLIKDTVSKCPHCGKDIKVNISK